MENELTITPGNKIEEKKIFEKICECICNKKSFIFDAGAGAGKTYELMQTLRYIISTQGFLLNKHNQKILCITYTNVAVEEIKIRLGNSSVVSVSTIHECLWGIISPYQEQLLKIHLDNISTQISTIISDLSNETWATTYRALTPNNKELFIKTMDENKLTYYKHKNDAAVAFRSAMKELISDTDFPNILVNVGYFKKLVDNLLKKSRYEQAVQKIKRKEKKYQTVRYDSRRNFDKLESMLISHNTLLDYAEKIVEQNMLLRRFIIDRFPYVLVDEYQDTNEQVVKLLRHVYDFAKEKGRSFYLAFFGDAKQNIYDEGIGNKIANYISGFERIVKDFNRRSATEIIYIANKIRADDVEQRTIYSNFPKACTSFYNIIEEDSDTSRDKLISKYCKEWNISSTNKLHCFELRNELVAKRSHFFEIYNFYELSKFYSRGQNFKYLSAHVLSLDSKKRGETQNVLLQILDFRAKVKNDATNLSEIIPKKASENINLKILRSLVEKIKSITGNTLTEYLSNIFNLYKKNDRMYDECIDDFIGTFTSIEKYKQYILDELFFHNEEITDEQKTIDKNTVDNFFNLPISIFESWHNYLNGKVVGDIVFHTFHSTKGLEFNNVLIFFESNFARDRNYFSDLFVSLSEEKGNCVGNVESARNLLYVAVTRAKYNLCILYLSDLGKNKETAEKIFGKIHSDI